MHVAARPIAKHELLLLLRDALALDVDVVPDDELVIDRSLDPARFGAATGFAAPEWEDMVQELAAERAAAGGVDARG
jgi:dTDP-4-dehydrorhamnose reductase